MAEPDVEPDENAETKKLPTTPPVVPPATPPVDKSQYVVVADEAVLKASKSSRKPTPAKGPLKPENLSADYIVVKGEPVTATTPVAATPVATTPVATPAPTTPTPTPTTATEVIDEPATESAPAEETPRVVYVTAPVPPKAHGNRGFGVLIALAASVIFAVLFAFAVLLILRSIRGFATMGMLANYGYWIPVGVFVLAMIIVVLVINRGGWWTYIIGSAVVAVLVYLGSAALVTVVTVYALNQTSGYVDALGSPTAIAGGIIAREVALWSGAIISRRGKRVRARNIEERAAFDREQATNAH